MKELPCIRDKCLKFAACRNRRDVFCSDLYLFLEKEDNSEIVYRLFPNVEQIYNSGICVGPCYINVDRMQERLKKEGNKNE